MKPEEPQQQLYDYEISLRVITWGDHRHEQTVTIRGTDEEAARNLAFHDYIAQFPLALYGDSTVVSCKKVSDNG